MLSPTTLTFSTLVLVLSDRPFRTGLCFYLGAVLATLAVGVVAALVLGDVAASSSPSTPKTWVAIVGAGAALANPGGFIPLALKEISELDPSRAGYVADWLFFTLVSVLPLAI